MNIYSWIVKRVSSRVLHFVVTFIVTFFSPALAVGLAIGRESNHIGELNDKVVREDTIGDLIADGVGIGLAILTMIFV